MNSRQPLNNSSQALNSNRNRAKPITTNEQLKVYQKEKKKARNQGLNHLYTDNYKPAVYKKAVDFKNSQSYKKKVAENSYKQIELFEDTNQLKAFGLGPYFFIQFQRRLVWLFFVFAIIQCIRVYINTKGTGLSSYQGTFGSFLVATTIGNYSGNALSQFDTYIITIIPCVIYFVFFMFFLYWKCHYSSAIKQEDENKQFIKPEKFCVEVEGFDEKDDVRQQQLQQLFSSFGPIYQISLARQYSGNLKYFQQLDELQEQIKQQELQIILGSGDQQNLRNLRRQKEQLTKYVNTLRIKPSVKSAYVHFQFQKSKVDMLQYYNDHYLFGHKNSHSLARAICCCCIDELQPKYLYKGKKLYIKNDKVDEPEDINWNSYQIGICGRFFRVLFSVVIILIFLAISCTIIGLCSIYISSHSVSCEGVLIPGSVAEASAASQTDKQKKCFCTANFISSFNSNQIKNYCGSLLNEVYTEQGIQYAITGTSAFVNAIFGIVIGKLVTLSQPLSLSTGYLWKSSISTIFLIFNTVFLPLLIYADIFGFRATNYVSFITIVSTDIRAFFNVDSIKFYIDFEKIWYRNVSPIFANFLLLDIVLTWIFHILYKCCCTKQSLQSKQGTILQKSMNQQIISWRLNASDQFAGFLLVVFMSLFYCAGMPVLILLAFVNLFSKYVANRSLLQNLSTRIDGLSEAFNSFPFTLIPILLILACVFGSWMLTANQIIYQFTNFQIKLPQFWWILDRQLILPFFIILALLVLFELLFYNTIIRFCSWLAGCCHDKKQVVHPYYTREYSHYAKTMSIMHSFNIRNNLKYKNAIINLQKYLENQDDKM